MVKDSGQSRPLTGRIWTSYDLLRRLSWLWILILGFGLFEAIRHAIIDTGNPNLVPALILLGATVVPAAFVSFLFQRRLPYDISGGMVMAFALIGGVIGIVTASVLEYQTLRRLGTLPMLGVGLVEETAKLLVPLAVLLFTRYTRREDGLLVGVAAGAGFAVLETMGYASWCWCRARVTCLRWTACWCCAVCSAPPRTWPGRALPRRRSGRRPTVAGEPVRCCGSWPRSRSRWRCTPHGTAPVPSRCT